MGISSIPDKDNLNLHTHLFTHFAVHTLQSQKTDSIEILWEVTIRIFRIRFTF